MKRPNDLLVFLALTLLACGRGSDSTAGGEATRSAGPVARRDIPAASEAVTPAGDTPIEITAVVDGRELRATGLGECEHAADGSIYGRPASLWAARFEGPENGDIRHLNLTFWRERSGTESVTMALQVGSDVHQIATVEGGEKEGSGSAALEGNAAAGTLTVKGTSAEGKAVEVRAKCSRFTTMVAEGG